MAVAKQCVFATVSLCKLNRAQMDNDRFGRLLFPGATTKVLLLHPTKICHYNGREEGGHKIKLTDTLYDFTKQ